MKHEQGLVSISMDDHVQNGGLNSGAKNNDELPGKDGQNIIARSPPATVANSEQQVVRKHTGRQDHLLEALRYLCNHHNLPFSPATAFQGLAVPSGVLALGQFELAAENLGLKAKLVTKRPSRVSAVVMPFVVPLINNAAGIVTARNGKDNILELILPGKQPLKVPGETLDREALDSVIFVTKLQKQKESAELVETRSDDHWLWSSVFRFWPSWLNVALAALLINLLGLALPLFAMNVYDRVIPNASIPTLWALGAGVVIALIFDFLLRMLRAVVIDNSGRRIDMKVSSLLFKQALDVKMAARGGRAGDLASHIREFETVRDFFTSASLSSMIDLFFIGVFLSVLWLIVGPLALVPMIAVPIVLFVTLLIQIPLAKSVAKSQATTANRHSVLVESLVGIETVKAISAEGVLQGRWEDAVSGSVRASSDIKFWSSLATYFCLFVQQAVSVGVIVWGVFLVIDNTISIGALIASNILAARVLAPLGGIAMTMARAQQSFVSLKQLNALMKLDGDHKSQSPKSARLNSAALQIKDLKFAYPNQDYSALDISMLNITPGERVGIVGMVGSGKSTLGRLLCGLYSADEGTIVLDGNEINQYSKADLRQAIAYVGQDAELFTGSLRENILFARQFDEERFRQAVNVSGVSAFAQAHPHGYEMQVGERGKYLSGGQRQAVTLARALMGTPKLLFLDEPTSGMDNLSEAAFVRGISSWMDSKTSLLVATHRFSLLELVNRILVFDKGKLVSDGPRNKIIAQLKKRKQAPATKTKAIDDE